MLIRPRVAEDLPSCVAALWEVHRTDGYPTVWPADPAAWLNPAGCTTAWVAESAGAPVGHVCLVADAHPADAAAAVEATGVDPGMLTTLSRLFTAPRARLGHA